MYTKILVPLDGSETAECVLPTVEWFVRVSNVKEIVILRVIEPLHMRDDLEKHIPPEQRKDIEDDIRNLAEAYCEEIRNRLKNNKATITGKILRGKPARTITEYVAEDKDIDLIIMATHGRSGVGRLLHGSTADQVVHDAVVPILLVTPHDRKPEQ
jgi:nucleotide-binding universal stress UspA family protein